MKILMITILVIVTLIFIVYKSTYRHRIGYALILLWIVSVVNASISDRLTLYFQTHEIMGIIYEWYLSLFLLGYGAIGVIEGVIRIFNTEFSFLDLFFKKTKKYRNGQHGRLWKKMHCKKIGVVFIKEESDDNKKIEMLSQKMQTANPEEQRKIEYNIRNIKKGIWGEEQLAFELKNSGIDMYVLHDILMEYDGQSQPAQIDYLVITRKYIYVMEAKHWSGNFRVDMGGNFIRMHSGESEFAYQGSYSPVTQNQRHLDAVIGILENNMRKTQRKKLFGKSIYSSFKSLIVFTNRDSYVDIAVAPFKVREQVIKADQLITSIKRIDSKGERCWSNKEMLKLANFYLLKNKTDRSEQYKRYKDTLNEDENNSSEDASNSC